jgi:hypothetical protein
MRDHVIDRTPLYAPPSIPPIATITIDPPSHHDKLFVKSKHQYPLSMILRRSSHGENVNDDATSPEGCEKIRQRVLDMQR